MKFKNFLRSLSTLQLALLVSILVHAVVLSIRFVDPQAFNRVFEDTPLEVILVNSKSTEAPDKAQAVAQANLAGGGESANTQERATSPMPYSAITNMGDDFEERQRQVDLLPTRRIGEPVEVAYTALFLASDEARYINATDILIDGGRSQLYHE